MINPLGRSGGKVRGQGAFMPFAAPCLNLHTAGLFGRSLQPRIFHHFEEPFDTNGGKLTFAGSAKRGSVIGES